MKVQGQVQRARFRSLPSKIVKTFYVPTKCFHFLVGTIHLPNSGKPLTMVNFFLIVYKAVYKPALSMMLTSQLLRTLTNNIWTPVSCENPNQIYILKVNHINQLFS